MSPIDMKWNAQYRVLIVGERIVSFSPTEYRLLLVLPYGVPVTYADLARTVYHCAVDEKVRLKLDKHIDRIRGKVQGTGLSIYCVLTYGYLLFHELLSEEGISYYKADRT